MKRVIFRPLELSDATTLFEIYSDNEAMKYRGSEPIQDLSDAQDMVRLAKYEDHKEKRTRLGIELPNGALIGTVLFAWKKSAVGVCEIGFSIGKKYWNQGYGTEILSKIERLLSEDLQTNHLKAWCIRENLASVTLFKKANYTIQKQTKYPGSFLFVKALE